MSTSATAASLVMAWISCLPALASAQTVEIAPVGGYRLGGGFFERVTQQPVDLDGAPAVGVVVNVPLRDGLFVEAFVTHQEARVTVPQLFHKARQPNAHTVQEPLTAEGRGARRKRWSRTEGTEITGSPRRNGANGDARRLSRCVDQRVGRT